MAKRIDVVNANPERYMQFLTGTGGLKKGQFAILSSGTAVAATEGVASAIFLGLAMEDAAEGAVCQIYPATGTEFLFHTYQGGSTDVFANANLGTPFDIFVDTYDTYLDANDTTGAFVILTSYDNTAKTAKGRILNSVIYVG
jgi:hypothetical protein